MFAGMGGSQAGMGGMGDQASALAALSALQKSLSNGGVGVGMSNMASMNSTISPLTISVLVVFCASYCGCFILYFFYLSIFL